MHTIESKLRDILEHGREPVLAELGGIDAIEAASPELATSALMPVLLGVLLRSMRDSDGQSDTGVGSVISVLLRGATADGVLMEAIDQLDSARPLPANIEGEVFSSLRLKASNDSCTDAFARAVALEGAFRFAASDRPRQLQILLLLLSIDISASEPIFLSHAAKIAGVAFSQWREHSLLPLLERLASKEEAHAEATFELGMAQLAEALDSADRKDARSSLENARKWFRAAASSRESAAEASLYGDCVDLLLNYENGSDAILLGEFADRIQRSTFELRAWHAATDRPDWLGSRYVEAAGWNTLSTTLKELIGRLDDASWWEPRVVIEQQLLAIYNAGRTLLKRDREGGITDLLRPRIEYSIARREGQVFQLKRWLELNQENDRAADAKALLKRIDDLILYERPPEDPPEAAAIWAPVAALVAQTFPSDSQAQRRVMQMFAHASYVQVEHLGVAEYRIYERSLKAVAGHEDHMAPRSARLFDTLLLWTVCFLKNRLDMSRETDPSVSYLFESADDGLPHEDALQQDCFRWLCSVAPASEIEVRNVAGGRVDIGLRSGGERVVIEFKRELHDSTFDALAASYAAQTVDYQSTSIRLGFLLVLDLVKKADGTPHIQSLVHSRDIQRVGEDCPRHVVIIKVPGQRKLPSALSKHSRSTGAAKMMAT